MSGVWEENRAQERRDERADRVARIFCALIAGGPFQEHVEYQAKQDGDVWSGCIRIAKQIERGIRSDLHK